jgi:amidase
MGADELISKVLAGRDQSLAAVEPALDFSQLPKPLPKNVIPLAKNVLTKEELAITGLDVPELLGAIKTKQYTCVTVTKAFLRRAALAQKLVR